jgi:MarR family transcriptional regulator, lower aerobic nicotinate degradation pathway regulator
MSAMKKARKAPKVSPLKGLADRPGFLIRRAHQISQSVFIEECSELDITSTQFGILWVLDRAGEMDQIGIARLLGFDRSTTALVVGLLERRRLVSRTADVTDRRRQLLRLTAAGRDLRKQAQPRVDRVRVRLQEPFTAEEAKTFYRLLKKFTGVLDQTARTPRGHSSGT